jgi:hypothetical protein
MEKNFIGKTCIIRTYSAGVWFGKIKELSGSQCVLQNARRLWYWSGAASLSQLAKEGTSKPDNCKFAITIEDDCGVYLPQVIEVLPCTEDASKNIMNVKIWKI